MTVPASDVLRLLAECLADDARRVLRALADPSLASDPGLDRLALTAWNAATLLCDEVGRRAGEDVCPDCRGAKGWPLPSGKFAEPDGWHACQLCRGTGRAKEPR